jgi:hypothetical protein
MKPFLLYVVRQVYREGVYGEHVSYGGPAWIFRDQRQASLVADTMCGDYRSMSQWAIEVDGHTYLLDDAEPLTTVGVMPPDFEARQRSNALSKLTSDDRKALGL